MKRYLPFVIIAAVVIVAAVAGMMLFRSATPEPVATVKIPPPGLSTPEAGSKPSGTPAVAVPRGVVTIEEYGDYQCPPCGALHPILKNLKDKFGNRMQINFHHLPLTSIHKNAQVAAQAAEAAKLQGKFWEMHDALYGGQSMWSELDDIRPIVADYARALGMNLDQFKKDLDSARVKAAVFADTQRAQALKIDSTPTLLIDSQLLNNENFTPEKLEQEIAQRLGLSK